MGSRLPQGAGCSPHLAISMAAAFPMPLFPPSGDQEGSSRSLDPQVIQDKVLRYRFIATPGSSRPTERMAGRSQEHRREQGGSLTQEWALVLSPIISQRSFLLQLPASLPDCTNSAIFSAPTFSVPFISFLHFGKYLEIPTIWHPNYLLHCL